MLCSSRPALLKSLGENHSRSSSPSSMARLGTSFCRRRTMVLLPEHGRPVIHSTNGFTAGGGGRVFLFLGNIRDWPKMNPLKPLDTAGNGLRPIPGTVGHVFAEMDHFQAGLVLFNPLDFGQGPTGVGFPCC